MRRSTARLRRAESLSASTQSQASTQVNEKEYATPPRVGSLIWDGKRVVETVTPQTQAEFTEFARTRLTNNHYSDFVAWKLGKD